MTALLVLDDYSDNQRTLRAGDVIDDSLFPMAELTSAGLITVPLLPSMVEPLARFSLQRGSRTGPPPQLVTYIADALGAYPVPPLPLRGERFVATLGDDVNGDGTQANPYATVARALQDAPRQLSLPGQSFVVQVVAPYSGPGFAFEAPDQAALSTLLESVSNPGGAVVVQAYYDAALAGVNDPRFSALAGPLVSSAAATYVGCARYTVPTGTLTDAMTGKLVRIFRAGIEVGRGTLAYLVIGATDTVYVATVDDVNANTVAQWLPTVGDELRVVDYAVRFNTAVVLNGRGATSLPAMSVVLSCFEIVAATAGSTSTLGVPVAPNTLPHAPLEVIGGSVLLASVRIATTVAIGSYASLAVRVTGGFVTTAQPGQMPWLPPAEAALAANAGGTVRAAQAHVNGAAQVALHGWMFDTDVVVDDGGVFTVGNQVHRGTLYAAPNGTLHFGGGLGTTLHNLLAVGRSYWNNRVRIAEFVRSVGGGLSRQITTGLWAMTWDPLGYGAGSPCFALRRGGVVAFTLQVNAFTGAAAHTFPVFEVQRFGSMRVSAAGTAVGPAGNTCRAGATNADYAGLPITDATNLAQITTA